MNTDHRHTHETHPSPSEEQTALLSYMIEHNKHHEEELLELAEGMDSVASSYIQKALAAFREGNTFLSQALSQLK